MKKELARRDAEIRREIFNLKEQINRQKIQLGFITMDIGRDEILKRAHYVDQTLEEYIAKWTVVTEVFWFSKPEDRVRRMEALFKNERRQFRPLRDMTLQNWFDRLDAEMTP